MLYQRALAGDASAAVAFDLLPKGEQSLAKTLVKTYGVTKGKLSKRDKKALKVTPPLTADQRLDAELSRMAATSDNPAEREYARNALAERRLV